MSKVTTKKYTDLNKDLKNKLNMKTKLRAGFWAGLAICLNVSPEDMPKAQVYLRVSLLPWDLVAASVLTVRTVWNGSHSNWAGLTAALRVCVKRKNCSFQYSTARLRVCATLHHCTLPDRTDPYRCNSTNVLIL